MIHDNVPFVSNSGDDLHCLQSAYLMILKYFRPELEMPWDEWSKITGYEEGMGTWASAGLLWFRDHGFEVRHISLFDYLDFTQNGAEYLVREFGPEVGSWQIEHTNMPVEQKRAKQLLASEMIEQSEPNLQRIKQLINDGYLVRVLLNARKLASKDGYFGHAVVVIGYDEDNFIIHDPGLPPLPDRKVSYEDFETAWADPNKEAKELDAIRYPPA